jgi:hypothetical protein
MALGMNEILTPTLRLIRPNGDVIKKYKYQEDVAMMTEKRIQVFFDNIKKGMI